MDARDDARRALDRLADAWSEATAVLRDIPRSERAQAIADAGWNQAIADMLLEDAEDDSQ